MAMRGTCVGNGHVAGRGNVLIFQDLDSTEHFFVIVKKTGEELYISRDRVSFRKGK